MELSKDKAESFKQIVSMLNESRVEALALSDVGSFVLCFDKDFTPFRLGTDGVVSIGGGAIWKHRQGRIAYDMAEKLFAKSVEASKERGVEPHRVIAMRGHEWSRVRVAILDDLIATWKKQAAEQGVSL